ncbi:MAG: hypothetical protein U0228_02020 [Myxococcaceae bacterium]
MSASLRRPLVLPVVFAVLTAIGCATVPRGDVEELKPTIESFHQRARWKDFRGCAELVVEERRLAFIKERTKQNDDKDLFITNFELEDAQIAPDMLTANAVTKISWYRLPSTTEKTAVVNSVFVWRESAWQLESQDDGPFEDLKPAPDKKDEKKKADAGVEAAPVVGPGGKTR